MTVLVLPTPEPKATIIGFNPDGSPIWGTVNMHRIRSGNGWIEIPAKGASPDQVARARA
ncbi:MAG: hypothetical protein ABI216_21610 [Devosia sp.]